VPREAEDGQAESNDQRIRTWAVHRSPRNGFSARLRRGTISLAAR
jgi:hypothetical protein